MAKKKPSPPKQSEQSRQLGEVLLEAFTTPKRWPRRKLHTAVRDLSASLPEDLRNRARRLCYDLNHNALQVHFVARRIVRLNAAMKGVIIP